jgi:protein-disulfide reductase (glutathione)
MLNVQAIASRRLPASWARLALGLVVAAVTLANSAPIGRAFAAPPKMAELWNGEQIAWQNVGPGIQESTRTGKTVVMVFHASWCTSCKRYRQVWKDPGVVAAARDLVMILVDVDTEPTANGAFSPDGTYVPRTIFYSPEGDVMTDLRGKDPEYPHTIDLDDPTELRTLMQKAAKSNAAPDKRAAN